MAKRSSMLGAKTRTTSAPLSPGRTRRDSRPGTISRQDIRKPGLRAPQRHVSDFSSRDTRHSAWRSVGLRRLESQALPPPLVRGATRRGRRVQYPNNTGASMRAVVTGGAGFIGSTLVDVLVARGDEV